MNVGKASRPPIVGSASKPRFNVGKAFKPPKRSLGPQQVYKPADWVSGGVTIGGKYNRWDTFGQGTPDMGKGAGPGDPYHVVQSIVQKPPTKPITQPAKDYGNAGPGIDPRTEAIRRRLRGL